MKKWKLSLLGLVGGLAQFGGCGLDLDNISIGGFGDLVQDVIFGVMFD